ncbi:OLC1v1000328C1 [Oldenlandia corymbosa var. corymbosa]|uniref:OLC1v1000328C1 n=1 Tax=Oldenlandia corymbosa var. corymbosa TaxID=529605 RepID=A0AAV1D644_OLDCO|nr:OLC1v1000328C1 [Oldenlandia corymbosa var. corymbosa]
MEVETELENMKDREGGAELVLNLQPSSSISIGYHSSFGPHDDLILLELDEKLLPDFLHERVTLRGQPNEDAVLCTTSKTYAVKFVGNSNSVFLIPPLDLFPSCGSTQEYEETSSKDLKVASIIKVAPGNMELVEVAPKLDKLKLLLSQNPYNFGDSSEMEGIEGDDRTDANLYRWEDLVDRIQASDMELRSGLNAIFAVEINGYWRTLDENYKDGILNMLLHNSVLNDWSLNSLYEDEVVAVLVADGYPSEIARHCLRMFGSKVNEGVGPSCWRLDERCVCLHFARRILGAGKMKLEAFMDEWVNKVPSGMHATFDMLEGEILSEKQGIETWIHAFSVSSLPSTPAERFSLLFHKKPKWEWKDLHPYVRDLKVPGLSSDALLLKYTRRTQPTLDAEPIFTAR